MPLTRQKRLPKLSYIKYYKNEYKLKKVNIKKTQVT